MYCNGAFLRNKCSCILTFIQQRQNLVLILLILTQDGYIIWKKMPHNRNGLLKKKRFIKLNRFKKRSPTNYLHVEDKNILSLPSPNGSLCNGEKNDDQKIFSQTTYVEQPASSNITSKSSAAQTVSWLVSNRFEPYAQTFSNFSGADMLRMTRDDFVQVCGRADGIRLHNALHANLTSNELLEKLALAAGIHPGRVTEILIEGPHCVRVKLDTEMVTHLKNETLFDLEISRNLNTDKVVLLLKQAVKNS